VGIKVTDNYGNKSSDTYSEEDADFNPVFIFNVKAAELTENLKSDLRMTAPLPTTLSMDSNGITATTQSDDTAYARMDYRGFYAKKGAFGLERPDGFLLVNNGLAAFDFSIDSHEPPYMETGVSINGFWYKCSNMSWAGCNYYNYKHTARYLKIFMAYKVDTGGTGWIRIIDGGTELWRLSFTNTTDNYITATIDLGVPTGALKSFYIQLSTTNSAQISYTRILRKWLEG
jgi:hypothetical protein